jgi:hypothetical protein
MILDHEWLKALAELTEHTPGMITSVIALVIYALLRDGLPRYKRWRVERNSPPSSNPGNSGLGQRVTACETDLKEVTEFCSRADERWKAQADHNKRMDKHVEKIHARIDGLAGLGK